MNITLPQHSDPDFETQPNLAFQRSLPLPRSIAVQLIQTGLAVGETRFAMLTALAWLAAYPGDIPVSLLHAKGLLQELEQTGNSLPRQALSPARQAVIASRRKSEYDRILVILSATCQADPEYLPAQELLAHVLSRARSGTMSETRSVPSSKNGTKSSKTPPLDAEPLRRAELDTFGDVLALAGRPETGMPAPGWSIYLRQARQAMAAVSKARPNLLPKSFPQNGEQEEPPGMDRTPGRKPNP
jgi:hypothetical protein